MNNFIKDMVTEQQLELAKCLLKRVAATTAAIATVLVVDYSVQRFLKNYRKKAVIEVMKNPTVQQLDEVTGKGLVEHRRQTLPKQDELKDMDDNTISNFLLVFYGEIIEKSPANPMVIHHEGSEWVVIIK